MAVRGIHFKRTEQLIWILIAVPLCFLEFRAISEDRLEHDHQEGEARAREDKNFVAILEKNQAEFSATMSEFKQLSESVGSVLTQSERALEPLRNLMFDGSLELPKNSLEVSAMLTAVHQKGNQRISEKMESLHNSKEWDHRASVKNSTSCVRPVHSWPIVKSSLSVILSLAVRWLSC